MRPSYLVYRVFGEDVAQEFFEFGMPRVHVYQSERTQDLRYPCADGSRLFVAEFLRIAEDFPRDKRVVHEIAVARNVYHIAESALAIEKEIRNRPIQEVDEKLVPSRF